jgi:hypothetical protein
VREPRLSGLVFCGHCGHKLTTRQKRKISRLPTGDPQNYAIPIYTCNKKYYENKAMFHCQDGQSTYRAEKVDVIVDNMVREIIRKISSGKQGDFVAYKYQEEINQINEGLKHARELLSKKKKESEKLKETVVNLLMENKDTSIHIEILNELKKNMAVLESDVNKYETRLNEVTTVKDDLKKQYKQIIVWSEVFDDADTQTKKMIISNIVDRVILRKGYEIEVELKISEMQYENGLVFDEDLYNQSI